MSEVVNQADECLLLFPLWTDRTAPCAKLMRELQSSQCIKWDHRIDLFYQDYTPLWKKIKNYFRSSSPQSPPKKQQQACLEKMKTVYSIYNTVSLFNPGGISSWLICHFSPLCGWSMCSSSVINCQAFARCPFTPSLQRERDPKPC